MLPALKQQIIGFFQKRKRKQQQIIELDDNRILIASPVSGRTSSFIQPQMRKLGKTDILWLLIFHPTRRSCN
jgi:hypothetical protein